jgi:hypothetical protein
MSRRTRTSDFNFNGAVFGDLEPDDEVYADCILNVCPTCNAGEGEFCTNRLTHKLSKLPCVKRMTL